MKIYNMKLNIFMLIIYMRIVNSLDQKLKAHKSAILTEFFSLQTYEIQDLV